MEKKNKSSQSILCIMGRVCVCGSGWVESGDKFTCVLLFFLFFFFTLCIFNVLLLFGIALTFSGYADNLFKRFV